MSETKHTPGKWSVEINEGRYNVWGQNGTLLVADCGPVGNDYSAGNAHLIAAALDLLVALKAIFDTIEEWDGQSEMPLTFQHMEDAKGAIRKAEGSLT